LLILFVHLVVHLVSKVEHPAAKVLVELAELQDQEVGDGTTSVVILACELLKVGGDDRMAVVMMVMVMVMVIW